MVPTPPHLRRRIETPGLFAVLALAVLTGGLLVGFEPVGGDPDRLYRPLKTELARALGEGRLPFWSERFGLGVPLVAESHVAAFYPPNQLFYRVLSVSAAYRLSMWLHMLALVVTTYAYARRLGLTSWGSAISSLAFALCGFQMIHATHEPFYCLMPYLPLALLLTSLFVETGRFVVLATLALVLGVQWTLGHFQMQMWTNGLVVLTGLWTTLAERRPLWRVPGLIGATFWGGAIAAVQLALSWDMARTVGHTARPLQDMAFFSFPPAHLIEMALPWFFRGLEYGGESRYFMSQHTTGYEAVFYVGTLPLILAFVGAFDVGRGRASTWFWRLLLPLSLVLATMPHWWLEGYAAVLKLPGLGLFRAPARYTLLTSFALALLAGQGFDRTVSVGRFRTGVTLAALFGLAAFALAFVVAGGREFRSTPGPGGLPYGVVTAGITWAIALLALAAWRGGKVGPWLPAVVTLAELGSLYFLGATVWGWSVPLPGRSPILTALANDSNARRIGGAVDDLPVTIGKSTATPYLGMTLSPINQLSHSTQERDSPHGPEASLWQRRLGVTHSVWDEPVTFGTHDTEVDMYDPALDIIAYRPIFKPAKRLWRVFRHPDPFPEARVAIRERVAGNWPTLFTYLSKNDARDEAWFFRDDALPPPATGFAHSARIVDWDGRVATVEHDGVCNLIITRAYDQGWRARINDGPEQAVRKVDGGLIAVRLEGSGRSRVALQFEPRELRRAAAVSIVATLAALGVIALSLIRRRHTA